MSKRAERRHHYRRLKKARCRYWGTDDKSPKMLGKLARTAAVCSCWMCRNSRKFEGETLQERKHKQEPVE